MPQSARLHPRGLTLIEVVAAIAILGTIMVGVTLSQSRHTRQLAAAEKQTAAAYAADELIAQWWTTDAGVPLDENGEFETADRRYAWETRLRDNPELDRWGARVVRVTVGPLVGDNGDSGGAVSQTPEAHRIHVDLVLPDPEWEPRTARGDAREDAENAEGAAVGSSRRGEGDDAIVRPDDTDSPDDPTRRAAQGGERAQPDADEGESRAPRQRREYPADQSDRWFERREKQ